MATNKTHTDVALDTASRATEYAQRDRTVFAVSPDAYAALLACLDAPPRPNERLRRTMQTTPPWD